ncbi:MAG: hypothetical protein JO270_14225 [Acidobacteriaceae bacterium]|nr:hypothetical protein [Acidobacteriaceae bacterium]MBV8570362.1 hypothetical protein [Acidobacteriaceae bacterium]
MAVAAVGEARVVARYGIGQQFAGGAEAFAGYARAPGGVINTSEVAVEPGLECLSVLTEIMQKSGGTGERRCSEAGGVLPSTFGDGLQVCVQKLPI